MLYRFLTVLIELDYLFHLLQLIAKLGGKDISCHHQANI